MQKLNKKFGVLSMPTAALFTYCYFYMELIIGIGIGILELVFLSCNCNLDNWCVIGIDIM